MKKVAFVVNEYKEMAELQAAMLEESASCTTFAIKNYEEVSTLVESICPDVCIIHVNMQNPAGVETSRMLRQLFLAECPILIASTTEDASIHIERLKLFDHVFSLPLNMKKLSDIINRS